MAACLLFVGAIAAATTAAARSMTPAPSTAQASVSSHASKQAEERFVRPVAAMESETLLPSCPTNASVREQARDVIRNLLSACDHVPDGYARFTAQLLPNGSIRFTSSENDPTEGSVPICALVGPLSHPLVIQSSCHVEVTLVERDL